jgi:hypothetical protein
MLNNHKPSLETSNFQYFAGTGCMMQTSSQFVTYHDSAERLCCCVIKQLQRRSILTFTIKLSEVC